MPRYLHIAAADNAAALAPPGEPFPDACQRTVGGLRAALLTLYAAIGADPGRPQEVARKLGLNKNLTWKVARLLQCDDGLEAVAFIPGPGGFDILLDAAVSAGAGETTVNRVRVAIEAFNAMVETHAGDRADLELLVDAAAAQPLEMSRRLAFRSNAGVWGLQARLRVTAQFLAPSATAGMLDSALVAGLVDVRRLRPVHRWPLFHFSSYNDDASDFETESHPEPIEPIEPIEPVGSAGGGPGWAWLMRSWSSGALPPLHVVEEPNGVVYELGDGPVGRTGQFSCLFGVLDRRCFPRHRDERNRRGELSASVNLPIATYLFDIYTHRDLVETERLEATLYGRPIGGLALDSHERTRRRLPMGERLVELGGALPQATTPLLPEWNDVVAQVFARAGWDPRDFVARRLVLEHPPMPSTVMLSYELPAAP